MFEEEQTYVIRVPAVSVAVLSEVAYCILYYNGGCTGVYIVLRNSDYVKR
jgi:hypothetical protein